MIQRIQTLYLLIVTILISLMFFSPIVEFFTSSGEIFVLKYNRIELITNEGGEVLLRTLSFTILLIVIVCIEFYTIFLYKKRIRQMRLCFFNILLFIGLLGMIYFFVQLGIDRTGAIAHYKLSIIFPVVSIILNYLAIRAIGKDEALIRSIDRIR